MFKSQIQIPMSSPDAREAKRARLSPSYEQDQQQRVFAPVEPVTPPRQQNSHDPVSPSAVNPLAPHYVLKYTLLGHTKGISAVKLSPNLPRRVISAGADGKLLLYDVEKGHFLKSFEGHTAGVNDVIWSPDGEFVASASDDQTVRLWQVETVCLTYFYVDGLTRVQGKCVRVFQGHTSYVYCLAFNPQGTVLVSGSFDETLRLWDVNKGLFSLFST